jgi:RNA polymerase sigma-70 factor (ECF subfamily)
MSEQLIQRWLEGDKTAAAALYQAHHADIYRLAYALLGDSTDANQIMQDVMVYALTHLDRYDPQRSTLITQLHAITVNRCRNHRRQKLPLDRRDGNAEVDSATLSLGDTNTNQENGNKLWRALDQLSPNLREALVLCYWGGHSYQEIAQILGCPLSTAQSRVLLAYEQLRGLLTRAGTPALREQPQ